MSNDPMELWNNPQETDVIYVWESVEDTEVDIKKEEAEMKPFVVLSVLLFVCLVLYLVVRL